MRYLKLFVAIFVFTGLFYAGYNSVPVSLQNPTEAKFTATNEALGAISGPYNRSSFRHWIDIDHDCQDTRQEVLIRDADGPIKLSPDGCRVISGIWIDPYTGQTFTDPIKLDVDHFVPLKNAYDSGAYKWDKKKREEYANYLGNNYH